MLEGLRKILREMFFIGIFLGIILVFANGKDANDGTYSIFNGLLLGLFCSPIPWALYRLIRFMLFPRKSKLFPAP